MRYMTNIKNDIRRSFRGKNKCVKKFARYGRIRNNRILLYCTLIVIISIYIVLPKMCNIIISLGKIYVLLLKNSVTPIILSLH